MISKIEMTIWSTFTAQRKYKAEHDNQIDKQNQLDVCRRQGVNAMSIQSVRDQGWSARLEMSCEHQ